MSYIDGKIIGDHIWVSERRKDGTRNIEKRLPPYVYYYVDPAGSYTSIYGDKLKRVRLNDYRKFRAQTQARVEAGDVLFESDIDPVFRYFEERYTDETQLPDLHVAVIDMEVDKDPELGWPRPNNPYAPITAITLYLNWADAYYTLALAPPNISDADARALLDQEGTDGFGRMTEEDGYFLFQTEEEMIEAAILLMEDADVVTGWNSDFFDIPYLIHRIRVLIGGESIDVINAELGDRDHPCKPNQASTEVLMKLNAFPCLPRLKMTESYGNQEKTYRLFGRVHLDYLQLFRKFTKNTIGELHSYSLDYVLKTQINETKVAYEGTLDQLYRNDFRRFIAYNRQDVGGLVRLDVKFKLIQLANTMAHMAGVTLDKTLGSVQIIEQAIIRRLHKKGMICFDKKENNEGVTIPGAYVVEPTAGMYELICSFDINSLYPSVIRAINISPEVVVGQFDLGWTETEYMKHLEAEKDASAAWGHFTGALEYHEIVNRTDKMLTFRVESTIEKDAEQITLPAHEWADILKESNWSISGNGTVFDMNRKGIVAECMDAWYADRASAKRKATGVKAKLKDAMEVGNKADIRRLEDEYAYWDMAQMAGKIFLNSTYGAYLNRFFRFYDPRLGRSVTLTSRCITKHMISQSAKEISGSYALDRNSIIYGDTDSVYCTMKPYLEIHQIEPTHKNIIKVGDDLGDRVNASFPQFMHDNFFVDHEHGKLIEAKRDVIATRGMFKDGKKRYALHAINVEGVKDDSVKIVGMETRRSDTPKYLQTFLERVLEMIVKENKRYDDVYRFVDDYRLKEFRKMDAWRLGSPSRVSNLSTGTRKLNEYYARLEKGFTGDKKPTVHYAVTAAVNTNRLIDQNKETGWDRIRDGDKIEVLYLKGDPEMSVVAIPVGATYVPDWFKTLPFDVVRMEDKLLDKKLYNTVGSVLGWDFTPKQTSADDVSVEEDFFA